MRTAVLLFLKLVGRIFYSHDVRWLNGQPPPPWDDLRIIAFLNHTSLYEWLYAAGVPNHLLHRIATRGYVPVADVTIERPLYGSFLRLLAPRMISISRKPDATWKAVVERLDPDAMVILFPEGRMKRASGRDKHGEPMTVRGGIADLLQAVGTGRMLIAYSGGLHHVQVPGQRLPRLFRTLRMALEFVDIAEYNRRLAPADDDELAFKRAVKKDLEERRDRICPPLEDYVYPAAD